MLTSAAASMPLSLLDRLRDDAATHSRLYSQSELRRQVLRDLQSLLNSNHYASSGDLRDYQHVQRSVLNFGVPTLAGRHLSAMTLQAIQQELTAAIRCFEPRILSQGLQVRCLTTGNIASCHNLLSIEIQGQLHWAPSPLPFLFHSQLDLENGHLELKEAG